MILGIDASQANRKNRSGTEWYAFYLIEEFKRIIGERGDIQVRLYTRDALQSDLANNLPDNFEVRILKWPFKYFWGQIRLSIEMLVDPPDVLFCPAHTVPLVCPGSTSPFIPPHAWGGKLRKGKTFTTLHDVGFMDYPELYDKLSLWYHRFSAWVAVKKAAHIFTISQFSKERIVANYNCDLNKITVTYLGVNNSSAIADELSRISDYGLKEKSYILYVGRLEPKKNILNMIKGYEQFIESQRFLHPLPPAFAQGYGGHGQSLPTRGREEEIQMLVLAGRKVRIDDVEEYLSTRPGLKERVKFLNYVSEHEKLALYKGASVFLFATLYEGFGLPILEAQCAEIPVITSNTASNPEIAGGGAVLVNPDSPYEIGQAIVKLRADNNLRKEKIALGLENVRRFSWRETAEKTLEEIIISP